MGNVMETNNVVAPVGNSKSLKVHAVLDARRIAFTAPVIEANVIVCRVEYTNGDQPREYDSIQAAAVALLAEYPDGVIYDAGGFSHDADNADSMYDVRSGRIALAWACDADSAGDPGAGAIAEIVTIETV